MLWFQSIHWKSSAKTVALWGGGALGVIAVTLLLFITFADWNAFRGPIGQIASSITGRSIVIAGDLKVRPWSLAPRIEVHGLHIGDPNWGQREHAFWSGDENEFAFIPHGVAEIELLPLLTGAVVLRRLELNAPQIRLSRDDEGRANWSGRPPGQTSGKPLKLPVMRRFAITGGALTLDDRRRDMLLEATLESDEDAARGDRPAFRLTGMGTLNRNPFRLEMTGGALINVRRDRPYDFDAELRAGATRIHADGKLNRPFDLGSFRANVTASGNDLADLYHVIGLSLPNTPPYRLRGVLTREERRYTIDRVAGRVGDSDLSGKLDVQTDRERPYVEASFSSRQLDFDDLATVLGAPPSTGAGESVSSEQRAEAARLASDGRLLPDARLDLQRVRNMDAHLIYRTAAIVDAPIPLRAASLDLTLNSGVMTFNPIVFDLPQGRIAGNARLDARENVPNVSLDMRLTGARLETLIPVENAVSGVIVGRVKLEGRGDTVRAVAASANGSASFVVPHGQIRSAFAELTGINVVRGLGLLLSGSEEQAEIRCGVADFTVRSGIADRRLMVIDTSDVLIVGEGGVNLDNETIDVRLQGKPKEARLLRLSAPITISGRLRAPRVGVETGAALAQAGAAGALGALFAPLAAILPFVDVGLADDANCAALLQQARGRAPSVSAEPSARNGGA
ncbi:MAG: AsmA family protein [Caulobacterales bacterium]